jgi:hypothetical protein
VKRTLRRSSRELGSRPSHRLRQAQVEQIGESLRAAAVSDDGRELLGKGRFTKPLTNGGGFDALAAIAPLRGDRRSRPTPQRENTRAALRETKAGLRAAEQRRRKAHRKVGAADARIKQLESELERARERAQAARAALKDVEADVASAERAIRPLERRLERR